MDKNKTGGSTDNKSNKKTKEDNKEVQPNPIDPKPEIEVPDFDSDGTITKSDLVTVESSGTTSEGDAE